MLAAIQISFNPVIIFSIRWYGFLLALGVAVVVWWGLRQSKKTGKYTYDDALTAALVGIPSGIVFSKLLHVIDNIVIAKVHPELILTSRVIDYTQFPLKIIDGGGLTIEGAVLGAALGIWVYSLFNKKFPYGLFVDAVAPAIILAQAIGRLGCLINGCCYGLESNLPFAIVYTNPNSYGPLGVPVLPTQFFEIVYNLIVFGILMGLRNRLKPDGSLFMIYLSLYAVWRIGIDFIRDGNPFFFNLHQAQFIGIVTLLITIPVMLRKTRWVKPDKPETKVEIETGVS